MRLPMNRLPMNACAFILLLAVLLYCSPAFADDNGNGNDAGDQSEVSEEAQSSDDAPSGDNAGNSDASDNVDAKEETKDSKDSKEEKVAAASKTGEDADSDDYDEQRLQSTRSSGSRSGLCKTIYLMYTRSEDVLATLKEVFEADLSSGGLSLTQNAGTNSIIMRLTEADNKVAEDVFDVINSLDFRSGQVLIDVLVVEMSINDDDIFGTEWKDIFKNPAKTSNTLLNMGIDYGQITADDPTAVTRGFKAFITSSNKMKLFLNALNNKGKVHVVSSPHIVTANHREANFKIGERLSLIDSVRPSDAGPITTYKTEDVGLELIVTPHINRAGEIDLEVHQTINAIVQDTYDPKQGTARMTNREAKTNLTVRDNETIILGGFIEDKKDRSEQRIPILSNIPVIGKIFTSVRKISRKTELMVFITPKVLNTREDAEIVTKTMISRTQEKDKTFALLESRKKVEMLLDSDQQVIIDRRSHGWEYGLDTPEIDDLVWQIPQKLDVESLELPLKGTAPFGFGPSKRLVPAPVRTYLKSSEGVVFRKHFEIDNPETYRRLGVKVACDHAASVYLNGILVDEDPMMKIKDGHDFEYWNRARDDIPVGILKKGSNTVVVFLGNEKDSTEAYFDLMLIGHTK